MGAWSYGPFGNDEACDFLNELECGKDDTLLRKALTDVFVEDYADAPTCERAVAAAAIIAAAAYEPVKGITAVAKKWILISGYVPFQEMVDQAAAAIERISAASELRELYEESESLATWHRAMKRIATQLAQVTTFPVRKPKKPGTPRDLSLLIKAVAQDRNGPLRTHLRKRLAKLNIHQILNGTSKHGLALCGPIGTPFNELVCANLLDEARYLYERGATPNDHSLLAACQSGELTALKFLLDLGLRLKINNGYSCELVHAAVKGYFPIIEELVAQGADLHQTSSTGDCLLHDVAMHGDLMSMQYLLNHGLDIDTLNNRSSTALGYAANQSRVDVVQFLLSLGANPATAFHFEFNKEVAFEYRYVACALCRFCTLEKAALVNAGIHPMTHFCCNEITASDAAISLIDHILADTNGQYPSFWFEPQQGLDWVDQVNDFVNQHSDRIVKIENIFKNLRQYREVFNNALDSNVRWRLRVCY